VKGVRREKCTNVTTDDDTHLTRILVFGVHRIVKKKETVTSRRQSLVEMIGEIIQLEWDGDNRFVGQDQLPCGIAQQQLGS
jgi:hypothetical protein